MKPFHWLTILFIGLKLAEIGTVATWSWWWVISPFWIAILLLTLINSIKGK